MERIEGKEGHRRRGRSLMDIDARPIVEQLSRLPPALMTVLHADPHPGNLILTDDGRLASSTWAYNSRTCRRGCRTRSSNSAGAISDGDGEEAALVLAG